MTIQIFNPRNVYTMKQAYYQIWRLREAEARERQLYAGLGPDITRLVEEEEEMP